MAIVQSSLVEDVLSRQERAVIRGIYRASQLNEALVILEKINSSVYPSKYGTLPTSNDIPEEIRILKEYLATRVKVALVSTKVPAFAHTSNELSPSKETCSEPL